MTRCPNEPEAFGREGSPSVGGSWSRHHTVPTERGSVRHDHHRYLSKRMRGQISDTTNTTEISEISERGTRGTKISRSVG